MMIYIFFLYLSFKAPFMLGRHCESIFKQYLLSHRLDQTHPAVAQGPDLSFNLEDEIMNGHSKCCCRIENLYLFENSYRPG